MPGYAGLVDRTIHAEHMAILLAVYTIDTTLYVSMEPCVLYLDWSDDRGHTFGNPVGQEMSPWGYLTSLQWQRLGMARSRVFEISWSANTKTALLGASFDATVSRS